MFCGCYGTIPADFPICDSCRDIQARPDFMIPSATGLSPKAHGEPAPKRVTKEFFKDLLAGGIAGADIPCLLEAADEEALHRPIPITYHLLHKKALEVSRVLRATPPVSAAAAPGQPAPAGGPHAAREHGHTVYMHAMRDSAVQCIHGI